MTYKQLEAKVDYLEGQMAILAERLRAAEVAPGQKCVLMSRDASTATGAKYPYFIQIIK
jgi:hypothetical protein